uniref:Telomeric repeat-binding factor 2-interacting protein 1 n=1 Tax=Knipowitschia caucasica TaxID=637954 RepID=A0AAV2M4F7_KNICA
MKQQLQPLITAGGGLLCNVQRPGAVLLCDPEDKTAEGENAAQRFVSTHYIQDCTEKNKRLNIEDYRLNIGAANSVRTKPTGRSGSGRSGSATASGRSAYTTEEDDAILRYVSKRVTEIGGNKLWQIMAQKQVTGHSWQSMKYRFRVQLAHRLQEYKQLRMQENKTHSTGQTEPEDEDEGDASPGSAFQDLDPAPQDCDPTPQNPDSASQGPEGLSAEMDVTQVSQSSEELADVEPTQESEASDLMELCQSDTDETPQPQPVPTVGERQTNARTSNDLLPNSVNRPLTQRQVKLGAVPNVRKLRSGTSTEVLFKWPPVLLKSKPAASLRSHQREEPLPQKKVQKTQSREAAQMQEESQDGPSAIMQTDEGNCQAPQPPEKRAEKRKIGILEMATKEFEDDSESDCDQFETPRSTSTEAVLVQEAEIAPSLTQDQLEEDVKLLRDLMEQSSQDIVSVTKSLLKASGDVALAFEILRNPSCFSGPVWTQVDNQRLSSMDPEARQDLLTKYGEESVAKRMLFLE